MALSGFARLNILQDIIPLADLLKIILPVQQPLFFFDAFGGIGRRLCLMHSGIPPLITAVVVSPIDIFTLRKLFYFEPS